MLVDTDEAVAIKDFSKTRDKNTFSCFLSSLILSPPTYLCYFTVLVPVASLCVTIAHIRQLEIRIYRVARLL